MADYRQILKDPAFGKLAREEQIVVMSSVDSEFAGISPSEQGPILDSVLSSRPKVDPFTKQSIGENIPIPGVNVPKGDYGAQMNAYSTSPERAIEGLKRATKLAATGGAMALTGGLSSIPAGAAAYTLADMGLASGEMKSPEDYRNQAVLGMALPGVGGALYNTAKPAIQKWAGKAAVALYQSAAKYPSTLKMADKARVALMGLREKIMFNPKSLEKLGSLNDELTGVADEAMIYAQMRGEGVPTQGIKTAFKNVTDKMGRDPVFGKETAEGLRTKFSASINELPAYMSPQEVLAWRRGLNEQLTGHFNQLQKAGMTGVETGLMKSKEAVRAAVNGEILTMVPELKALGRRQKDIIDLLGYTEKRTSGISNWDVVGLGALFVGDLVADAAGVTPTTKAGTLGTAAAGMLAWRTMGSPNAKARVAFLLAKAGKLDSASPSTLELIGLTRQSARSLSPKMKALPYPRTMGTGKPETPSGIVQGGQETVHAEQAADLYEQTWAKYAQNAEELRQGGQFAVIPKAERSRAAQDAQLGPFVGKPAIGDISKYDQIKYPHLGDVIPGRAVALSLTDEAAAIPAKIPVKYVGEQMGYPMFQQEPPGVGSFIKRPGETVAQAFERASKRFK